jgi:hypothetical protein
MASFSRPFSDDIDDWARLSGLPLQSSLAPGLGATSSTVPSLGQGLSIIPTSSSSNMSPALYIIFNVYLW